MCVLFAPFRCDDLFAQQWKGASARGQNGEVMERGRHLDDLGETMKTMGVTRLEVEAWQLVMLVSIGWLILCVVHYAINIRLGHQPRRIAQRGVDRDRTSRAASPIGISLPLQLGEVDNSSLCYTTQFGTVLMLRQPYHVLLSAHIHTRPALNEAGCEQWLLDCVEATKDGWEHVGRITDICVLSAPFRCDDLFARRGKYENAIRVAPGGTPTVEDIASFEVKAWQLVMLLGIGWLIRYAINILLGHQSRRIVQQRVDRDRTSRLAIARILPRSVQDWIVHQRCMDVGRQQDVVELAQH